MTPSGVLQPGPPFHPALGPRRRFCWDSGHGFVECRIGVHQVPPQRTGRGCPTSTPRPSSLSLTPARTSWSMRASPATPRSTSVPHP